MLEESDQHPQKIKVAVRIRPLQEHELNAGHDSSKIQADRNVIQ